VATTKRRHGDPRCPPTTPPPDRSSAHRILAAVGGGRIVWARTATASEIRPTESALVTADAATGSIGTAVRFIATFGSGPLCPAANATYAGITDAGTAGAIVTCQNTPPAAPWRFSVDPTTGVSTAPHFAPSELLGKVWAWNADVTGIQLLACDGVAATPAFADPNPSGAVRNVAYEPPFGAAPRWRHDQLAPQPGAQLITCGRSRPTILERSGTPRSWQFGGTQLSWLAAQSGGRTTASLYDLRKARLQTRVRISTRRSTVTVGHIADRLLIQTTARATRHTPATSHIRVYTAH